MHARGEIKIGESFVHESLLGTEFTGTALGATEVGGMPAIRAVVDGLRELEASAVPPEQMPPMIDAVAVEGNHARLG